VAGGAVRSDVAVIPSVSGIAGLGCDGLRLGCLGLERLREWAQIWLDVVPLPERQPEQLAGAARTCQLERSAVGPCAFACIAFA
jgi:hypothetical protein